MEVGATSNFLLAFCLWEACSEKVNGKASKQAGKQAFARQGSKLLLGRGGNKKMRDLQVKNGTWMCIREAMWLGRVCTGGWCRSERVLRGGALWVGEEGQGGHRGSRGVYGGSGMCKR